MTKQDEELVKLRKRQIKEGPSIKKYRDAAYEYVKKYNMSAEDLLDILVSIFYKHCSCNLFNVPEYPCADAYRKVGEHLCDSPDIIRKALGKKKDYHLTCGDCMDGGFCVDNNRFWLNLVQDIYEKYEMVEENENEEETIKD